MSEVEDLNNQLSQMYQEALEFEGFQSGMPVESVHYDPSPEDQTNEMLD